MRIDSGGDRRAASRYSAKGPPAFLGWYEGDDYRTTAVKLVDVSMTGIKAEVEAFPSSGASVAWLCLVGQKPSQWIEVGIIATITERHLFRTRRLVRLRFLEPCTYDFFKGAIEGFSHEVHRPIPVEDGLNPRDWR
jgi:hypothetical protein